MEYKKILNLLNEANDSRLVTKNGTLSFKSKLYEIKLPIIQKYQHSLNVSQKLLEQ